MPDFYYLYEDEKRFPFPDGYTKITADTRMDADAFFRKLHPLPIGGRSPDRLNCSNIKTEQPAKTLTCHESINITVEYNQNTLDTYLIEDEFRLSEIRYNEQSNIVTADLIAKDMWTYTKLIKRTPFGIAPENVLHISAIFDKIDEPVKIRIHAGYGMDIDLYSFESQKLSKQILHLINVHPKLIDDLQMIKKRIQAFAD